MKKKSHASDREPGGEQGGPSAAACGGHDHDREVDHVGRVGRHHVAERVADGGGDRDDRCDQDIGDPGAALGRDRSRTRARGRLAGHRDQVQHERVRLERSSRVLRRLPRARRQRDAGGRPTTRCVALRARAASMMTVSRSPPPGTMTSISAPSWAARASGARAPSAEPAPGPGRSTCKAAQGAPKRVGQTLALADHGLGGGVGADEGEHPLRGRPGPGDAGAAHPVAHVGVDMGGRAAERDLAQCGEVALAEEAVERAGGVVGAVDLALLQAGPQLGRGDVDQFDLVGHLEHAVRQRLGRADAGDAGDVVVEALEVLDVERAPDVDAGGEQFGDVLPALGVAAAGGVGVREFVDEQQPGAARQGGVEVELLERLAAVRACSWRGSTGRSPSWASVSARPCVSISPARTSAPSARRRRAWVSISQVLPTPGAAPRKILRRPCRRSASVGGGEEGVGVGAVLGRLHRARSLALFGGVQGEVQREHVDRAARRTRPSGALLGMGGDEGPDLRLPAACARLRRARSGGRRWRARCAGRGRWPRWSPRPPAPGAGPARRRRPSRASSSALLVGPRLEPPETAAL